VTDFVFPRFRAVYLNVPGLLGLLIVTVGCGLVIYARYAACDPVSVGQVKTADQVIIISKYYSVLKNFLFAPISIFVK